MRVRGALLLHSLQRWGDLLGFVIWLFVDLSTAFVFVAPSIEMAVSTNPSGDTNSIEPPQARSSRSGKAYTVLVVLAAVGGTIWFISSLHMLVVLPQIER